MRHETDFTSNRQADELSVWPVLTLERAEPDVLPAVYDEALALRSAPMMPDVPPSVGYMIFGSYLGLVAALAFATVARGPSALAIAIVLFFVAMFFAVPRIMLAQEAGHDRRPTLESFLARGMVTYTGHSTGAAALIQMLVVPIALTAGVLAIAAVIALS